jgi:hypothetical protein
MRRAHPAAHTCVMLEEAHDTSRAAHFSAASAPTGCLHVLAS